MSAHVRSSIYTEGESKQYYLRIHSLEEMGFLISYYQKCMLTNVKGVQGHYLVDIAHNVKSGPILSLLAKTAYLAIAQMFTFKSKKVKTGLKLNVLTFLYRFR